MSGGILQLKAALRGDFQYEVDAARGSIVQALGLGMSELALEMVGKLRTDVERSGLANANRIKTAAWRHEVYGAGQSLEPAAWIFSKLPIIVQAFENGVTIRAKGGKGLLIPNPDVWPGGRARFGRGKTMGDLWALATARFGELVVVRRPGKTAIVVAQARENKRGGFSKASASAVKRSAAGKASGLATIVVFVLAKEAKLPRLLKGATIRARAQRDVPSRMQSLFTKYFTAYDGSGPRQITNQSRPRAAPSGFTIGPSTW